MCIPKANELIVCNCEIKISFLAYFRNGAIEFGTTGRSYDPTLYVPISCSYQRNLTVFCHYILIYLLGCRLISRSCSYLEEFKTNAEENRPVLVSTFVGVQITIIGRC